MFENYICLYNTSKKVEKDCRKSVIVSFCHSVVKNLQKHQPIKMTLLMTLFKNSIF